jgi:hypothetical protein
MHDRVRLPVDDQIEQPLVFLGDVHAVEGNILAGNFVPGAQALAHGANGRERPTLEFDVDLPPGQIVDDRDVMALGRQMERGGPSAKAVTAQNQNLH